MDRKTFLKSTAIVAGAIFAKPSGLRAAELHPVGDSGRPENPKLAHAEKIIFPVGEDVEIRIPIPDKYSNVAENFKILCAGDDGGFFAANDAPYLKAKNEIPFSFDGSTLSIKISFPREQRYTFLIYNKNLKDIKDRNFDLMAKVYALNSDIFQLTPFKCDFHMHSTGSDGKETPVEAGIKCMETGFDYQSLSDHSNYSSSVELMKEFKGLPISMNVYMAEEIHKSVAHILVVGASDSVTNYIAANKAEFDKSCDKYLKSLTGEFNDEERQIIARAMAEIDIAHKLKGYTVFAHPYWRLGAERIGQRLGTGINSYLSDRTIDALLMKCNFDAVEAVNATARDEQTDMMTATISEFKSHGRDIPIIGVSDAHHPDQHGKGYTIAFAKTNAFNDIWSAIKSYNNVAVDSPGDGTTPIILGRRRFVRFAFFLLEEYFPLHDILCAKQAEVLSKILKGGRSPELMESLKNLGDQTKALYASMRYS